METKCKTNIGLVTLFKSNYGSALQCYSLKHEIEKRGYECDVLEQKLEGNEIYISKINTLLTLIANSLTHPSYFKSFREKRKSSNLSISSLNGIAAEKINFFVKTQIKPLRLSLSQLKSIGNDSEYSFFVAGSDQVWNGISPYQPFYFLNFSVDCKKIAYAPSFGGTEIKKYNRRYFKKSIKNFSHVSAREDEGVEIINNLTQRVVPRVADPTVLLSNEEWIQFSENCTVPEDEYVFVHFLDRLSDVAIKVLQIMQNELSLPIICFSYPHNELNAFADVQEINGSPEEYIALIRKAKYVLSDSFHTALFSIRFNRQLYVFPRQYKHGQEQSSRIISLLNNSDCINRYIKETPECLKELPNDAYDSSEFFDKERQNAIEFLDKAIGCKKGSDNQLKSEKKCVGCGICELVCPKKAIKMCSSERGFLIPNVNQDLCINCGLCAKVCHQTTERSHEFIKKGYIAFNTNHSLRAKSASGGIFSSIASSFLENGGVVVGARLYFEDGKPICKHSLAHNQDELEWILASKYVQSDCRAAFIDVKQQIALGVKILFAGTSCQIAALYKYLGANQLSNLYTIDLVCHGVPGIDIFSDYINYLEKESGKRIIDYKFRSKTNGEIKYEETIYFEDKSVICRPYSESIYCNMFLNRVSYREACYRCDYASLSKPADITIGDYFEARKDYPELFIAGSKFHGIMDISCMIIHSKQGLSVMEKYGGNVYSQEISVECIQNSHEQLCHSSKQSTFRLKFFKLYSKGGFKGVEQYYQRRNMLLKIPRMILSIVKRRN